MPKSDAKIANGPRLLARVEPDASTGVMRGKLHLFDQVGGYEGIYAKDVAAKLDSLKDEGAKHLDVHIHSPGGDVFEGVAIHSMIAGWDRGEKQVHVDGLAASIASLIAMAGDKVTIGPHAMMMLHNAKPFMFGAFDSPTLRKIADRVDQQQGVLAKCYAEASGKSEAEILEMMAKETWLTAEDAVKQGFADAIEGREEEDAEDESEEARFRAVASVLYASVPPQADRLLAFSPLSHNPPAEPAQPQESTVTFEELKTKLAAAEKATADMQARAETAEKGKSATDEQLATLCKATGKETAGEAMAVITALKETAAKLPELQAEIAKRDADAKKLAEERQAAEIKAMLDAAGKDGRLTPAKRKEIDEGTNEGLKVIASSPVTLKAYLDSLPKVAVSVEAPVVEPKIDAKAPATVTLTDEDKKVIEETGADPVLFALAKADPSGQLVREEQENRRKAAKAAAEQAAAKK